MSGTIVDEGTDEGAPEPVTDDDLLGGRVRLRQPAVGYRVAVDPVLLAAAVRPEPGSLVLDAGAGAGAGALCLTARVSNGRIVALERDPAFVRLARHNVEANGRADRVTVVAGDLGRPDPAWAAHAFDEVMTNPPFHAGDRGTPPPSAEGARAESDLGLDAWLRACLRRLCPGGRLTLVHRADRLDGILTALAGRAGDVVVFPLWPSAAAGVARRVIVRARKGARGPLRLARGLVLHEACGAFTPAAEAVLRHAAPLILEEGRRR